MHGARKTADRHARSTPNHASCRTSSTAYSRDGASRSVGQVSPAGARRRNDWNYCPDSSPCCTTDDVCRSAGCSAQRNGHMPPPRACWRNSTFDVEGEGVPAHTKQRGTAYKRNTELALWRSFSFERGAAGNQVISRACCNHFPDACCIPRSVVRACHKHSSDGLSAPGARAAEMERRCGKTDRVMTIMRGGVISDCCRDKS